MHVNLHGPSISLCDWLSGVISQACHSGAPGQLSGLRAPVGPIAHHDARPITSTGANPPIGWPITGLAEPPRPCAFWGECISGVEVVQSANSARGWRGWKGKEEGLHSGW
jgi:hypothetical protein